MSCTESGARRYVWVATAAGGGRLNTRNGAVGLYNERNTPMYEIWTYAVNARQRQGLLRGVGRRRAGIRRQDERWKDTTTPTAKPRWCFQGPGADPRDHDFGQLCEDKILWVATYFGDSRYDGRNWHNFLTKDSGLPSNFTNQVKAVDANRAWFWHRQGPGLLRRNELGGLSACARNGQARDDVRDADGKMTRLQSRRRRRTTTSSESISRETTSGSRQPKA